MPETLAFRHIPFEDLGLLEPVLVRRGHAIRYVDTPSERLDDVDPLAPDLLIVLGGPMGVYESDIYPYLSTETALITRRIDAGKPILGLCLGSQLIASALGARVYPSGIKEIGWSQVQLTQDGRDSSLKHLETTAVLHWHGDTFDLPAGAVRLASSALTKNQAFSWGDSTLALQFHAEAAGDALESWFTGHAAELAAARISVAQLRADTARWTPQVTRFGAQFFDEWLTSVGL